MRATSRACRGPAGSLVVALVLANGPWGCRCRQGGRSSVGDAEGPAVVVVDPEEVEAATREVEPNDAPRKAMSVEGRLVEGTLGAKDRDCYRMTVEQVGVLRVSVDGVADADLLLEALDATGQQRLVKVDNAGAGGGETLVNLGVDPGEVLVCVRERRGRAFAADATYRLRQEVRAREEGEEVEPNWKQPDASALPLGGEAIGYHGWRGDEDWYLVSLEGRVPESLLRLEFDGVEGVRATVSVHDAAGKLIQSRSGNTIVLANIALPRSADTAFVEVKAGRQFNVESRYSLRVSSTLPQGRTEVEPNDKPAQASRVDLDAPIDGILGDRRDRDFYRCAGSGPCGASVVVGLGVDPALAVVDGEGKVLWEVNAGGAGEAEHLPVVDCGSGRLLRLRAVRADGEGRYRLTLRARSGEGTWEREPNDEPDRAQLLSGGRLNGFIHPADDVDLVRVSPGHEGGTVVARGLSDLVLERLDAAGKVGLRATSGADGEVRLGPLSGGDLVRISGGRSSPSTPYHVELAR